jgi:hypothetical protein
MTEQILGYDLHGEPICPAPKGSIVTQAFILCSTCRGAVSTTGGPRHGSTCLKCWPMREEFETITYSSLNITGSCTAHGLRRKPNGEYMSDLLEDHWNTFQEGWEAAKKHYGVEQ